jgi:hypothetical protein
METDVTFTEPTALQVANVLRENGYRIANSLGEDCYGEPDHRVMGILKPEPTFLGRLLSGNKAAYLGNIYLNDESVGAEEGKKWFLKVYGREFVPELTDLFKGLAQEKGVSLEIKLDRENAGIEYVDNTDYAFEP